jgi:hypothetical protein
MVIYVKDQEKTKENELVKHKYSCYLPTQFLPLSRRARAFIMYRLPCMYHVFGKNSRGAGLWWVSQCIYIEASVKDFECSMQRPNLIQNVLSQVFIYSEIQQITLKASGSTSATTIQIIHPAAKPVQKGRNLLNASAHMNAGTATMGCHKVNDQ